jgi:hypothetical protein
MVHQRGQAAVFLVLAMGIFVVGGVGFVVDGANLWFHRQSAQTAADAACTAGAMDLLSTAAGASLPNGSDWIGNSFDCASTTNGTPNSSFPPCTYAALNGYSGSARQKVQVSFPGSANASISASCSAGPTVCKADAVAAIPYMQVSITDDVATTFIRLLGSGPTASVPAKSLCGLTNVLSSVPVTVLNPIQPQALTGSNFNLSVIGTAQNGIQVNSVDPGAVNLTGVNTVTLTNSTSGQTNFAVASTETETDAGNVTLASGNWVNAAGVISDPFALISPPSSTLPPDVSPDYNHPLPCPGLPSNVKCDLYGPGHYPDGITVTRDDVNGTSTGLAVFEPGVYYLDGDFVANNKSCIRPGSSGGTVFYFHGAHTLNVGPNSGRLKQRGHGNQILFDCQNSDYAVPASSVTCWSSSTGPLTGNVLIAPCVTSTEPAGVLFFQDRAAQLTAVQPTWNPAGSSALIGNIYFHQCNSSTPGGSGANCDSAAFTDVFTLGGAGPTTVVGDMVVDQLKLTGSSITVSLDPTLRYTLKASLLQ